MSIIRTGDPIRDAANFALEADYFQELYDQGNADCVLCGKLIREPYAYVLDANYPTEECICQDCMIVQKRLLQRSGMDGLLRETLTNYIDELRMKTPHDTEKEGFTR